MAPIEVRNLVKRYGDYVSYDPPLSAATAPLWIAPLILLVLGGLIASRSFKRKPEMPCVRIKAF